ncbi:hypothetical protein VE03_10329, partial [Pseudogymnoascus sp. 23342-1-I1]
MSSTNSTNRKKRLSETIDGFDEGGHEYETEPEIMDIFSSDDGLLQHLIAELSETAATEEDQEAYGEAPTSQPPSIQTAIKGMESALEFMESCEATTPE